ncbi:cysteine desulfurase family protein [Salipaludibacillus daqingensis]|uniref:cysteine desulfurase family protein n=1 Tax=Salipaludibacillus daqingensis TaxID=3041001 RepID=UPI0024767876|nr:cysteine desulfurase family protein [Salipaludibacillus daqingensis]
MIYLDNSATTAIAPEVLDVMLPYLKEEYGNPSSKYYSLAENAKKAVADARQKVANLIGCEEDEVIFTSGATESNNMILKGVSDFYSNKGNHIITSKVEHPSTIETCKYLETKGFKVTYLDVDQYGRVNIDDLESLLSSDDKPILLSIIWGNNEIGSLNNIESISKLCHEYNVFFHTDATQVMGKVDVNIDSTPGITFLSCSAHKVHGPKGVGACVIRKNKLGLKTKITPLLHGGGQENDYRSGTLAVHNIVGFGKAAELAKDNLEQNSHRLHDFESQTKSLLIEKFGNDIYFNNDETNKIPGLISLQLRSVNNELFIRKVADRLAISTGSACSSTKPSHVLAAIGKDINEVRSTLRITLSQQVDMEQLSKIIKDI